MGANKGTQFESELKDLFTQYEGHGLAVIRKVDPPTLTVTIKDRGVPKKVTKNLPNPFLDFTGVWREAHGRAIMIEAKHTEEPTLAIGTDKGLTKEQWDNGMMWEAAGAVVLIVWQFKLDVRISTPNQVRALCIQQNRKSVRWEDMHRLKPGYGFVRWDILDFARKLTGLAE